MKRRFGITIAGGQGRLSGKICRIGHCGYYDYRDIVTTLAALELVLAELGQPVELGAGVAAAQRVVADAL
jgi:aspartate aminotransferase-like enzyme